MDPITLIISALVAGAAAGGQQVVTDGMKDAYQGLRSALGRRFADRPAAETALVEVERHVQDAASTGSGPWGPALEVEIARSGADSDTGVVGAAQQLMELLDSSGAAGGKYLIDTRGSQGVQVGDRNIQHNTFESRPHPSPRS